MTQYNVGCATEVEVNLNGKQLMLILHVDDELNLLKIAKQCLEMQGQFQVDTASSVEEAMEKLKKESYDAVVSDYWMPGKDGLQFLKEVRESRNDIPFIIFTGKGSEEVAVRAWNLGADHYVNKNGDPEVVYSELSHCLGAAAEKHVAETQTRDAAQKLHAICENAVEGISLVDSQENLVYVNKAFADILGCQEDQLVGTNIETNLRGFVDEENWTKIRNETESRQKGKVNRFELVLHRPDGSTRNVQISASPLFDYYGRFAGTVSIVLDITELKRAEEDLEKERHDLDCIVDSSPIIIFYKDKAGRFMRVNKAFAEAFRTPKEGFLGKTVFDLYSAKIAQGMANDDLEVLESGRPKLGIIEQYESASGMRWVQTDKVPIFDKLGIPVGLVGFAEDITERKKAEEELLRSVEQTRQLLEFREKVVDTAVVWIDLLDREGNVTLWNRAAELICGYSREEVIGHRKIWEWLYPDASYCAEIFAHQRQTIEHKESVFQNYETIISCKNGALKTISWHSNNITDEKGEPLGSIAIGLDVTDVKRIEKELFENHAKLQNILAASPDAITVTDMDGNVVECNQAALDLHGYTSKEELIGKNAFALIAKKDHPAVMQDHKNALEQGPSRNLEYTLIAKDGHEFPAEVSTSVIKGQSGKPTGFVGISKDITLRKRMEKELKDYSQHLSDLVDQKTKELKETQEKLLKSERLAAIGELAGMVGHDLRNPLMSIVGAEYYLKTQLGPQLKEKDVQVLKIIEEEVAYSNKIVNDLQDYSKEMKLERAVTNPRRLLEESLSVVNVPGNIQVLNETGDKPEMQVDLSMLKRVFVNVIKNAVDAMPDGGRLAITTNEEDGLVEFSLKDTGPGIPKELLEKIGKPLFTTKPRGMGFGLAICKRAVEAHEGKFIIESTVGKGTNVKVLLPIMPKTKEEGKLRVGIIDSQTCVHEGEV